MINYNIIILNIFSIFLETILWLFVSYKFYVD